jgi:hypothetical protein
MAKSHLKLVTPATVNRTVTPKRAPNYPPVSISAMDLKDRLRNIETDCRDRLLV